MISIHVSLRETTANGELLETKSTKFQSTSLYERRLTKLLHKFGHCNFNPRLSTRDDGRIFLPFSSIHHFNPRLSTRDDIIVTSISVCNIKFQSTSLYERRQQKPQEVSILHQISIHVSLRETTTYQIL